MTQDSANRLRFRLGERTSAKWFARDRDSGSITILTIIQKTGDDAGFLCEIHNSLTLIIIAGHFNGL